MTDEPTPDPTYVRVYADSEGESHFEDVHLPSERHSSPTGAMEALTVPLAAQEVVFRKVLTEASDTTPHNAPTRLLIIQVNGTVEVEVSDGEIRQFGPGSALLVEDTTGKGHLTRNLSLGARTTLIAELTDQ
jgi:hypothetical protein